MLARMGSEAEMAEQFKERGPGVVLATVIAIGMIALIVWIILEKLWTLVGR